MQRGKTSRIRNLEPQFVNTLEYQDSLEAAVYTRNSPSTMAKLRCYGGGPNFIRVSPRKIVYRKADLDAWLAKRVRTRTGRA
jgi:hypothetical protein